MAAMALEAEKTGCTAAWKDFRSVTEKMTALAETLPVVVMLTVKRQSFPVTLYTVAVPDPVPGVMVGGGVLERHSK